MAAITLGEAISSLVNGLSTTRELGNRYFLLFDINGNAVGKVRADAMRSSDYGYIIIGDLN